MKEGKRDHLNNLGFLSGPLDLDEDQEEPLTETSRAICTDSNRSGQMSSVGAPQPTFCLTPRARLAWVRRGKHRTLHPGLCSLVAKTRAFYEKKVFVKCI